jgi:hypothetical protein
MQSFALKKNPRKHIISGGLVIKYWYVHMYNAFLFIYLFIFIYVISSSFIISLRLWQSFSVCNKNFLLCLFCM